MIKANLERLRDHIDSICKRLGKSTDDVALIGVTKYTDCDSIQTAVEEGLQHIAESKVQDARPKLESLDKVLSSVTKHFIGHLQTNKVKYAVEMFDWIHSVDSVKLAREISNQAVKQDKTISILFQVNTSGEEQKYGLSADEVIGVIKELGPLTNVKFRGLMTMAPYTGETDVIRKCFSDLRILKDQVREDIKDVALQDFDRLSMGMSGDYEIALEEGSNILRVGSTIFSS